MIWTNNKLKLSIKVFYLRKKYTLLTCEYNESLNEVLYANSTLQKNLQYKRLLLLHNKV